MTTISVFVFEIGGFCQGRTSLQLENNTITHREQGGIIDAYSPTQAEWEVFEQSLNKLNVWNWKNTF